MSVFSAFACKAGLPNNVVVVSDDFSSNPDALAALGSIPLMLFGFNSTTLTYQVVFTIGGRNIFNYFIQNNVIIGLVKPIDITLALNPNTVCFQPVTNSIGFKFILNFPTGNGLVIGNTYEIGMGINFEGNLTVQILITRSKSCSINT